MFSTSHKRSLVFASLSLLFAASAHGTVFCVGTSQELSDALTNAQMDLNTNAIHLKAGRYITPGGSFKANVNAGTWTIDGGYDDNCNAPALDARLSVLDGNAANPVFDATLGLGAESLLITNLTVANGKSVNTAVPAGMNITGASMFSGLIIVDRAIFTNNVNSSISGAGASRFDIGSSAANLRLSNNLFASNKSAAGAAIALVINGNNNFLTNNTIVGNTATFAASTGAAITFNRNNAAIANFSNNIFWSNIGPNQRDVTFAGDILQSNDFELAGGFAGVGSTANFQVAPEFRSAEDFHLVIDSTLIGLGTTTPPGGIPTLDLDGMPRVIDMHADIGAYGHELLFRDGFELIGE